VMKELQRRSAASRDGATTACQAAGTLADLCQTVVVRLVAFQIRAKDEAGCKAT